MSILYHIIPKGDGYNVLGVDPFGEFYLVPKNDERGRGLVFNTPEEAYEYMRLGNINEDYIVEAFWMNKEFRCPECGSPLMTQYVVGSDETESNFTERVCSCRNHSCELDWRIYSTADGHIVKIERFFCG